MKKIAIALAMILLPLILCAQTSERKVVKANRAETQKFLISTNLYDWADYGTVNLAMGYSLSRHFSVETGFKFNDWQFKSKMDGIDYVADKQKTAFVGLRYWPWYVYSGWWISLKGQYSDRNRTGLFGPGDIYKKGIGAGMSTGFTLMITKKFNVEVGGGFWAGKYLEKTMIASPHEEEVKYDADNDKFFEWNDLSVSLQFLF